MNISNVLCNYRHGQTYEVFYTAVQSPAEQEPSYQDTKMYWKLSSNAVVTLQLTQIIGQIEYCMKPMTEILIWCLFLETFDNAIR